MKRFTRINRLKGQQAGFTIVELMIATAVFSMVLLVILYGVLSFSEAYFGGINNATTQDTARTVVNDVSSAVQFSGDSIYNATQSGSGYYFCAGGATYYYILGAMYDGGTPSTGDPGLYEAPGGCTPNPTIPTPGGEELLAPNLRITYLLLQPVAGSSRLYTIAMGLAYGQSDLLCRESLSSAQTGGCAKSAPYYTQGQAVIGSGVDDVSCRHVTGYQYCAHAGLTTTVSLRVANGALGP